MRELGVWVGVAAIRFGRADLSDGPSSQQIHYRSGWREEQGEKDGGDRFSGE